MTDEEIITSATKNFVVKTSSYEGPFEVILDLIEKRKLSVSELSLSQITDDYITFVREQGEFPIEDAAQFIGVAATLLLIKSKSLIPELELSEEEEGDVEDFKRRLAEYERVREMTRELSKIFGKHVMVAAGERVPEPFFAPSRDFTQTHLSNALASVLAALEKEEEKMPEARVRPLVTIEEMMDTLMKRVQNAMTLSFKEFSRGSKEKVEIIVSFLAMLELVKQGNIDVDQYDTFSDIKITNTSTSIPRY